MLWSQAFYLSRHQFLHARQGDRPKEDILGKIEPEIATSHALSQVKVFSLWMQFLIETKSHMLVELKGAAGPSAKLYQFLVFFQSWKI